MPLAERPGDVKDFLGGGKARGRTKKKAMGEKAYLLHLPTEEMARIKVAAARRGQTMKEFFAYAMAKACSEEEQKQ